MSFWENLQRKLSASPCLFLFFFFGPSVWNHITILEFWDSGTSYWEAKDQKRLLILSQSVNVFKSSNHADPIVFRIYPNQSNLTVSPSFPCEPHFFINPLTVYMIPFLLGLAKWLPKAHYNVLSPIVIQLLQNNSCKANKSCASRTCNPRVANLNGIADNHPSLPYITFRRYLNLMRMYIGVYLL